MGSNSSKKKIHLEIHMPIVLQTEVKRRFWFQIFSRKFWKKIIILRRSFKSTEKPLASKSARGNARFFWNSDFDFLKSVLFFYLRLENSWQDRPFCPFFKKYERERERMRRLNAPNSCDEALATKVLRLEKHFDMYLDPTFNYGFKFIEKSSAWKHPRATILQREVKGRYWFQIFSRKFWKKSSSFGAVLKVPKILGV